MMKGGGTAQLPLRDVVTVLVIRIIAGMEERSGHACRAVPLVLPGRMRSGPMSEKLERSGGGGDHPASASSASSDTWATMSVNIERMWSSPTT